MKYLVKNLLLASDHAGFKLKDYLIRNLSNIKLQDLGCDSEEPVDYPDFAKLLCKEMLENYFGVLICGSGIGMSIAANRFPHIRAALCHSKEFASLARKHNNANIIILPARFLTPEQALEIVNIFLTTKFESAHHQYRISKL